MSNDNYEVIASFTPPEYVYSVERENRFRVFEPVHALGDFLNDDEAYIAAERYALKFMVRTQVIRRKVDPDE